MKIFIDNLKTEKDFVAKLIRRLKAINYKFSIDTWETSKPHIGLSSEEIEEHLNNFDIFIAIITPDYLSDRDTPHDRFNEFSERNDKYIIPIIYLPTHWSSKNWIVKSKIFPETDDSFSELPDNLQETTLNTIVRWIESILSKTIDSIAISSNKVIPVSEKSIFISHSHEDADFAELLHLRLEKSGFSCWIDSERLKIGQEWRQEIDDGITNSIATIAIITPEAKKSEYVTYEWAFAWGRGKKIFPVLLKQTGLHPRLESLQYLDFTNRNSRPWDKLIDSIKELIEDN